MQIRVPRNLPAEGLDLLPTYVVADDSALFTQPHTNASEGFYDLEGGALARSRAQDFDDAWARAIEHAELRQLRL